MKQVHRGLGYLLVTEVFGDIPCTDPETHKANGCHNTPEGCWFCYGEWANSLPWVRPSYTRGRFEDDEAILSLLRVPDDVRKMKRRKFTYRDRWKHLGPGYEGYVTENFGIEIGEHEDPESYPYWRIADKTKPKMIIPLLRERICYEPTMKEFPIYIEIARQGLYRDISFHGLSNHWDISINDLRPILFAHNCLFDADEVHDGMFGSPYMNKKFKGFIAAAEKLGENRERFSIPNLCKNFGAPRNIKLRNDKSKAGYKSRDSYYSFIKAVKREGGPEKADQIERKIREAYELASLRPRLQNEEVKK